MSVNVPDSERYLQAKGHFDTCLDVAGHVPPSKSAYLALLTALPSLHTCALQLLQSLLHAAKGAFTPYFASCSHLLANLLRQIAAQPEADAAPAAARLRQQVRLQQWSST